jgi:hypothetical protein
LQVLDNWTFDAMLLKKSKPREGSGVTSPVFPARRPKKCEGHVDPVLAMRRLRSGKREAHALKNACR